MNKKSAIATAGGLVASFVAGVAAVSFNWGLGGVSTASPSAAASATPAQPVKVKPIVKHRTITIHKKAPTPKSTAPGSRTVVLAAPASTAPAPAPVATTSGSHAAGGGDDEGDHEREGGGDD